MAETKPFIDTHKIVTDFKNSVPKNSSKEVKDTAEKQGEIVANTIIAAQSAFMGNLATKNNIKLVQKDIEAIDNKIDNLEEKIDAKIDAKIDQTKQELNTKIDQTKQELNARIDGIQKDIKNEILATENRIITRIPIILGFFIVVMELVQYLIK